MLGGLWILDEGDVAEVYYEIHKATIRDCYATQDHRQTQG
jgi:hypothetical protein